MLDETDLVRCDGRQRAFDYYAAHMLLARLTLMT